MDNFYRRRLEDAKGVLNMPELKIFWILVPFLLTIFVINAFLLTPFFIMATGGFVLVIAIIVFFYAASLAKSNLQVRSERGQLRSIVFSLEEAVLIYDKNFKILFFNPAAETMFRLKTEAIVGKEITPKDAENFERQLLTKVLFPSLAPIVINRSEAGIFPQVADISFTEPPMELRIITTPIFSDRGEAFGFVKIVRDRTRDVAILRSKGEFVTIASHQLRTPITGINWALSLLANEDSMSPEAKQVVKSASDAGRQLLNIVEDLLAVSKIEDGRFGYRFEAFNIVDSLHSVLSLVLPQARKLGIKVYFDQPQEPLPPVIADQEKLTMVVENIIDNAIRYNVKNGEITIKVDKVKDQPFVRISIKDTGIGISTEDSAKIFNKFFRAQNALKFETEGSGLGLYVAQNIVRAHGGKMWFESEQNRGTTFYFTLATDPSLVPQKEVPLEY